MKSHHKFYILTDEIGVGKTTLLSDWSSKNNNIGGILSPVVNGKRFFKNIRTQKLVPLEHEEGTLSIGKYRFDEKAFQWAEEQIEKALLQDDLDWLIIDEIGPLEIKHHQGFHHLLLKIINSKKTNPAIKILLVIRQTMVLDFLKKYPTINPKILSKNLIKITDWKPKNLLGIVLCGGESTRMKTDKALLQYQNIPQYQVAQQMLEPFCEAVLLSINQHQNELWGNSQDIKTICDDDIFEKQGPLTGILSAQREFPDHSFFILGVDYPLLRLEHLIQLHNHRSTKYEAICFEKEGYTEPLIAIIEQKALTKIPKFYQDGGKSLKKFLEEISVKKITLTDDFALKNANDPQDFITFKRYLNGER